jgi:hypothetical protein
MSSHEDFTDKIGNGLHDETFRQLQQVNSINIPKELFEKLYLSPQTAVKGDLRKTFGNPTPLYVSLFPSRSQIIILIQSEGAWLVFWSVQRL